MHLFPAAIDHLSHPLTHLIHSSLPSNPGSVRPGPSLAPTRLACLSACPCLKAQHTSKICGYASMHASIRARPDTKGLLLLLLLLSTLCLILRRRMRLSRRAEPRACKTSSIYSGATRVRAPTQVQGFVGVLIMMVVSTQARDTRVRTDAHTTCKHVPARAGTCCTHKRIDLLSANTLFTHLPDRLRLLSLALGRLELSLPGVCFCQRVRVGNAVYTCVTMRLHANPCMPMRTLLPGHISSLSWPMPAL